MDHRPAEDPNVPTTGASLPPAPPPPPPMVQPLPPPVGPPVTSVARRVVESIAGRARFAQVAIGLNLAATAVSAVALSRERALLVDFRDGVFVPDDRIDAVDRFSLIVSVIYVITFIVAIVAFLRWFSRAYKNLAAWKSTAHTTGWAVGAWFVPFLNLWRPFKIAEEIAMWSDDPRRSTRPRVVTVWWSTFVLSSLIDRTLFRRTPESIDSFITENTLAFVSIAAWSIAGVAAILMIREISAQQERRIAEPRPNR